MIRGGNFNNNNQNARAANRNNNEPTNRNNNLGFRLARPPLWRALCFAGGASDFRVRAGSIHGCAGRALGSPDPLPGPGESAGANDKPDRPELVGASRTPRLAQPRSRRPLVGRRE